MQHFYDLWQARENVDFEKLESLVLA